MSPDDFDAHCSQLPQAAAFVLGALDEDEAADYRRHLTVCPHCRGEVAELRPVVDLLPNAAAPASAPPELRDRVMAVVRAEGELLRAAGAGADRPVAPERERRRLRLRPLAALATAAALAIGVAVGLAASGGSAGLHQTRAVVAARGAGAVLRQAGGRSELVVSRLPAPPSGRIYQVWLKRPGQPPAPTDVLFGVNRSGSATVDVPGSLHDVTRVMVTSEPPGGSLAPTSAAVLTVTPSRS